MVVKNQVTFLRIIRNYLATKLTALLSAAMIHTLEYFSTISTNVLFHVISFDDNPAAQVNQVGSRQYFVGNLQNAHLKTGALYGPRLSSK